MVLACARELMYGVPVCRRIIIWEACAVTLELKRHETVRTDEYNG